MVSAFWQAVAPPAVGGALLALFIEAGLTPRPAPPWKRPSAAQAVHFGLWFLAFAAVLAIFRRPYFAAAIVLAFVLLLVLVSNAKQQSLREPFIYQDFEYFIDALKHPRLYLPFLGVARGGAAVVVSALAWYAGIAVEPSLGARMPVWDFVAGTAALAALGAVLVWAGARKRLPAVFEPDRDLRDLGLAASLWAYAVEESRIPDVPPAYDLSAPVRIPAGDPPQMIVVQSESFFDARRMYPGIRKEVLQEYDAIKGAAVLHGRLEVHAWGANTVRPEFAFLSGFAPGALGVHRFNPYRRFARRPLPTLAGHLRALGYRTVCVHPYPASFYSRDRVFPLLGFDEFIDVRAFGGAARAGPYVSDVAVAHEVGALLETAGDQPLFVFVITMENHGPLHLERVGPEDVERLYDAPPPEGFDDLTAYLRHLANADRMIRILRERLESLPYDGWLCWYGDHVPVMPKAYDAMRFVDGRTDYFVWGKRRDTRSGVARDLRIEELGLVLLECAGLVPASNGRK